MQGGFANRINIGIAGFHLVIHDDAAALAHFQVGFAGQFIPRTNTGRDNHHVGIQAAAVFKIEVFRRAVAADERSILVQ